MVPTALSRLVPELVVASTDQVLTPVLHKKCLIMKNLGLNFPHQTQPFKLYPNRGRTVDATIFQAFSEVKIAINS